MVSGASGELTVNRKKTVLVVVAHADDMEFLAGGTVARFIDEKGYDVYEYILTDNAKGSYRLSVEELVAVSAKEAVEAGNARVVGTDSIRIVKEVDRLLSDPRAYRAMAKRSQLFGDGHASDRICQVLTASRAGEAPGSC